MSYSSLSTEIRFGSLLKNLKGKLVDFTQTRYLPRQTLLAFWKKVVKVGKDAPNANFAFSTWTNHQDL